MVNEFLAAGPIDEPRLHIAPVVTDSGSAFRLSGVARGVSFCRDQEFVLVRGVLCQTRRTAVLGIGGKPAAAGEGSLLSAPEWP